MTIFKYKRIIIERLKRYAPVNETIVLGSSFLSSSSYTFSSQVNLSTSGTYAFNSYTTPTGDINPGNDTLY